MTTIIYPTKNLGGSAPQSLTKPKVDEDGPVVSENSIISPKNLYTINAKNVYLNSAGDNSRQAISLEQIQINIGQVMDTLSKEIQEKVPEGPGKKSMLEKLKDLTTNETFASVSGILLDTFLRRMGF